MAALVVAAGLALVSSPWWVRMARDLAAERSARIREQERAEVAAHVHDSVLQTLTLIQRHADDPREVDPAGPRPGARAARLALPARAGRDAGTSRPRSSGWPPRSRTRTASPIEVVVVGDCAARRAGSPRCCRRRARRWSTRRSTRGGAAGLGLRRGRAGPGRRCSCGTAARASTWTPCPRTGSGLRQSIVRPDGSATAARPPSAPPPATGPRWSSRCPARPGARRDRPSPTVTRPARAGRARRRPPDVPHRRAGRARRRRDRGRRRGRGRRSRPSR